MSKTRKFLIIMVTLAMVLSLAAVVSNELSAVKAIEHPYAWAMSDRGIYPTLTAGNNDENTYVTDYYEKIEPPVTGTMTYPLGTDMSLTVTIGTDTYGESITSWVAVGITVEYFIVKAGTDFFTYEYVGTGFDDDGSLYPPINNGDEHPAISHYAIYYSIDDPEETTTTVEETTTTAEETTTTETQEVTTTTPQDETVTETTTTIILTETSIPLVSTEETTTQEVTTTPQDETVTETTTIILTTNDIPKTGETGSGNGLVIGLIMLLLAGGLTVVLYRSRQTV